MTVLLGAAPAAAAAAVNPRLDAAPVSALPRALTARRSLAMHHVPMKKAKVAKKSWRNSSATALTQINNPMQTGYIANVTIGNVVYPLLLDTGSSDTWIPIEGFQCLNADNTIANVRRLFFLGSYILLLH
jgi:hypothetical protein